MHDSDENKKAFALALLKNPNDPFGAALKVFPRDTGYCLRIAQFWPNDEVVLAEQNRLQSENDEMHFLPGKAELARQVWNRVSAENVSHDDFVKLAKLYADVRGFIAKDQPQVSVNVDNRRVMVVKDLGSDEDWEAKAERQQRELLNVSTSRH